MLMAQIDLSAVCGAVFPAVVARAWLGASALTVRTWRRTMFLRGPTDCFRPTRCVVEPACVPLPARLDSERELYTVAGDIIIPTTS
jgi:hypothetical protein